MYTHFVPKHIKKKSDFVKKYHVKKKIKSRYKNTKNTSRDVTADYSTVQKKGNIMPNWTSNTVTIQAKPNIIKDMKESLQGEKTVFDFNKIIPMPDSLNITSGSVTHESILIYLTDKLSFRPDKKNPNHNRIYQYIKNTFSKDWPVEVYDRLKKASIPEYKMEDYYNKGKQYIFNIEHYHAPTWYE